jgi:hypothetical protein
VGEDAAAPWIACSPEWKAIILSWLGAWHDTLIYEYENCFTRLIRIVEKYLNSYLIVNIYFGFYGLDG